WRVAYGAVFRSDVPALAPLHPIRAVVPMTALRRRRIRRRNAIGGGGRAEWKRRDGERRQHGYDRSRRDHSQVSWHMQLRYCGTMHILVTPDESHPEFRRQIGWQCVANRAIRAQSRPYCDAVETVRA